MKIELQEDGMFAVVETGPAAEHVHPPRFATEADARGYCSTFGFMIEEDVPAEPAPPAPEAKKRR